MGSHSETYYENQFSALGGGGLPSNKPIIDAALFGITPPLTEPVNETRIALGGGALIVDWAELPTQADVDAVTALVPTITGVATTSQPFEYNSFGVSTSTSGTPVTKLNNVTPPLDAGTYQVIWTSSLRMQAVIANTGAEATMRITRSDGVFVEQTDAWDLTARHAYNGAITFQVLAGQTLTTLLTFVRLGASGVAELNGARITVDKLS